MRGLGLPFTHEVYGDVLITIIKTMRAEKRFREWSAFEPRFREAAAKTRLLKDEDAIKEALKGIKKHIKAGNAALW
jgi:hypothetical protein